MEFVDNQKLVPISRIIYWNLKNVRSDGSTYLNKTTFPIVPFGISYWPLMTLNVCARNILAVFYILLIRSEFLSRLKQNHRHEQICFTSFCVWNCFGMLSFTEVSYNYLCAILADLTSFQPSLNMSVLILNHLGHSYPRVELLNTEIYSWISLTMSLARSSCSDFTQKPSLFP